MNDLITIVIPVYKVEDLLPRCMESVLKQTYGNIEILLIDDGSPDKCPLLCDKYKKIDNRVKVFHKKNGGLSSARNVGIENSCGNYICFIDSDDVVSKFFIEELYNNIIQTKSDVSICSYKFIGIENDVSDTCDKSNKIITYSSEKAIELMLYQKKINNSAWGKLYKKELFEDIRFPEGKIYEDIPTTYKTFLKSDKICVSKSKYYFYTKREDSISGHWSDKTLDIIDNVLLMEDDLKKYNKYKKACNSRVLNADFFVIRQLDDKKNKEIYETLYKDIKKRRVSVLFDIKSRLKTKIGIIFSFFGIDVLKFIYGKSKNTSIVKKLD